MAKKLIVQRNLGKVRGSGANTRKYLWIVVVVLAFIVIITPYLLRQKSGKEGRNGTAVEHGAITKEMPKPAQEKPDAETSQALTTGTTAPVSTPSEAVKPQQEQPVPGSDGGATAQQQTAPAQEQPASPPAENAESVSTQSEAPQPQPQQPVTGVAPQQQQPTSSQALPQSSKEQVAAPQPVSVPPAATEPYPAVPAKAKPPVYEVGKPKAVHKVLFPQKTNHCKPAVAAQSKRAHQNGSRKNDVKIYKTTLSGSSSRNKASQPPRPGARPGAGADYAVQVGSVYRSVGQAQLLQKKLAAKGYRASIHRVACSGFLVVTTPSSKSNAYTLREQMSAVGLKKTKVVPTAPVSAGSGRK